MDASPFSQRRFFVVSFFILLILIFLQLIGIFWIFFHPLLWAAVLAMIFYPLYSRALKLLRGRRNLAATLVTLLVIALTVGPMVFFTGTLVKEMLEFYSNLLQWITERRYQSVWFYFLNSPLRIVWDKIVERTASLNIELAPLIGKSIQSISNAIVGQIQHGAKNFLIFVLNYLATIFIFFFFIRDGESMGRALKDLFPMTRENKDKVFGRLLTTVSAVVRGLVVTGVVQAILGGAAFAVLGVPFPVFLAFLIAFFALVPIGGAVLVWFPSSVYLALSGHWGKGLTLFIWGALVVSAVDNFLKPLLIGGKTKLPTIFLFVAILGGLAFYGLIGVFLGPVMLALFLTLIEIYRKEYSA